MRSTAILAVFVATMVGVWGAGSAMAAAQPTSTSVQAQIGDDVPDLMDSDNSTDGNTTNGTESDDGNVTDGNETDGNATFGQQLNQFKHLLRNGSNVSFSENLSFAGMDVGNASFGMIIAEWAVRNNPGKAPPWAGPANKTRGPNNQSGPPSWAENGSKHTGNQSGPPNLAGNKTNRTGNETGPGNGPDNGNGNGNGNSGGPPGQLDRALGIPLKSNTLR